MLLASPRSSFSLRRLAGGAAVRLAAVSALAVVAIATVPMVQQQAAAEPGPGLLVSLDDWSAASGGKIDIRHRDAVLERDLTGAAAILPAVHAMPMAIAWQAPQTTAAQAMSETVREPDRRQAVAVVRTLPPTRPVSVQPLVLAAHAEPAQASPVVRDEPGFLPGIVALPLTRAGSLVKGAVTGAAGGVVTAGSWTLSQASNLLPRW